ncbi:T9SS type A sorting domain-containing protein [bacterium]|nr:T9SS type A sorting domain-containing protein [bacterium]
MDFECYRTGPFYLRPLAIVLLIALIVIGQSAGFAAVAETDVGHADQPSPVVDSKGNVHIVSARYNYFTCLYRTSGTAPHRYTIFEWDTYHKISGEPGRFQVVLYESGNIVITINESSGAIDGFPITGVNCDSTHGVDLKMFPPPAKTSYRFTWDGVSEYTWKEITYLWLDASKGEPVWAELDDSGALVPIGFDFNYYGETFSDLYVSSNGYVSFTDATPYYYMNPTIFPSGNVNASKVIAPLWDDWNPEPEHARRTTEIFYSMVDGTTGEVLILPTLISDWDAIPSARPSIAVDSDDNVHITWHDGRWDEAESKELAYTKLSPYLDDHDGDAAYEPQITLVDDMRLTNLGGWANNPRMDVDSNDEIHIVWENAFNGIYYMEIDKNGLIIIEPICLKLIPDAWRTSVDVAVDSQDNPHITWNDQRSSMIHETWYMMLDGSDFSTKIHPLINATMITVDDNLSSTGQSITVDSDDRVHIVWLDKRSDEVQEIWHTKLIPSSDDQDGDAADPSSITMRDDQAVASAGLWAHHSASATGDGQSIHIAWWSGEDDNIYYKVLDIGGSTLVDETALTTASKVGTASGWTVPYLDVDAAGTAHVTWFDWRGRGIYYDGIGSALNKPEPETGRTNAPKKTVLHPNYPNPFNPETIIGFSVSVPGHVQVAIYNANGQCICTLKDCAVSSGEFQVVWNGRLENGMAAPTGLYFCRLQTECVSDVRKIMLVK